MAEYICKDDLLKKLKEASPLPFFETNILIGTILVFPTADVQPVKHSKWKLDGEPPWYVRECPECNEKWFHWSGFSMPNYCPNCGAKMDGET